MDRGDRRAASLLILATAVLTPIAWWKPHLRLGVEDWVDPALAIAFRPSSVLREARAAGGRAPVDPEDADLVSRLLVTLDRQVAGDHEGPLRTVPVLGVEGRGGGGLPDRLVLDCVVDRGRAERWAGRPAVAGEHLVGFVGAPGDAWDGLLRVDLVGRRPRAALELRRLAAVARSRVGREAAPLHLLVEPARRADPHPLRVLRAVPRHLDTWSADRYPYVARTAQSELLHPRLPDGLVLGRVESVGYAKRAFVLQRFVRPEWDPRSLVRVAILGVPADGDGDAELPGVHAVAVRVGWRSPARLGYRRYLLRGDGVVAGAAVMVGVRCLGRVRWARGGIGVAVPLGQGAELLPVVVQRDGRDEAVALVLDGRGSCGDVARFFVVHAHGAKDGSLVGGRVFTGVQGRSLPHGLLIGRVLEHRRGMLRVETPGAGQWPESVAVVAPRGRS